MEESNIKFDTAQIEDLADVFFEEVDVDDDGEITFEELEIFLSKHPGVAENLSITYVILVENTQDLTPIFCLTDI